MEAINVIEGVAAPMPERNIDTDAIIPAQCLRSPSFNLADGLFLHKRFDENHAERPDFVLNRVPFRNAKILVAGDNFGCGSSREHAVWALKGFGVRCVISTSFGEIFFFNCFKNGVLPIVLAETVWSQVMAYAEAAKAPLRVDLGKLTITGNDLEVRFKVDARRRELLMAGLDDIGITMKQIEAIRTFTESDRSNRPWVYEVSTAL